jgi:hypothetical protein
MERRFSPDGIPILTPNECLFSCTICTIPLQFHCYKIKGCKSCSYVCWDCMSNHSYNALRSGTSIALDCECKKPHKQESFLYIEELYYKKQLH